MNMNATIANSLNSM